MGKFIIKDPGAEFCRIVELWKLTGQLTAFFIPKGATTGVRMNVLFEWLLPVRSSAPDHVTQALGLPAGASYGTAARLTFVMWNQRPSRKTDEDERVKEVEVLKEICQQLNGQSPEQPQLPVVYLNNMRRPH